MCSRHLYGADRMLTAWPADDEVIVLPIARHDSTAEDVCATLLVALDMTVTEEERAATASSTTFLARGQRR